MEKQLRSFFEQRLTNEQREQVLSWFPELEYDDKERGFYDPETSGFHDDFWFLNGSELTDQETIHLCVLMKKRSMVDVMYTCSHCGNSWLDTYIRIPQDVSQPYEPLERVCDRCHEPVEVKYTREFYQQCSDYFL
jgi:hypothetical protein